MQFDGVRQHRGQFVMRGNADAQAQCRIVRHAGPHNSAHIVFPAGEEDGRAAIFAIVTDDGTRRDRTNTVDVQPCASLHRHAAHRGIERMAGQPEARFRQRRAGAPIGREQRQLVDAMRAQIAKLQPDGAQLLCRAPAHEPTAQRIAHVRVAVDQDRLHAHPRQQYRGHAAGRPRPDDQRGGHCILSTHSRNGKAR